MRYVVTGISPQGKSETKVVEADHGDLAVAKLVSEGYQDVKLRTGEDQTMVEGIDETSDFYSADEYLALQKQSFLQSIVALVIKLYRASWINHTFHLGYLAFRFWNSSSNMFFGGGPRGFSLWVIADWGFTLLLLSPLVAATFTRWTCESQVYNQLINHLSWHRWSEALELIPLMEKIPDEELKIRKAQALAGLGRLEEAEQILEPLGRAGLMNRQMYLTRIVCVYEAFGDWQRVLELSEEAAEIAPDDPLFQIDLAMQLARQNQRLDETQVLLDRAKSHELEDLASIFVSFAQGWIDFRYGRHRDAIKQFQASVENWLPYIHATPLIGEAINEAYAVLAILYAEQKDFAQSRDYFAKAQPRLLAQNRTELISAYLDADKEFDYLEQDKNPYRPPSSHLTS